MLLVTHYMVVIEQGETSFGAYVPDDLPSCIAAGETEQEVLELITEAVEFHLEELKDDGISIPSPTSSDRITPPPIADINEALAELFCAGGNPEPAAVKFPCYV